MITKEVNNWIRKVEQGNYSAQDIMEEFTSIARYLTKEEILQIKNRLNSFSKHKNML